MLPSFARQRVTIVTPGQREEWGQSTTDWGSATTTDVTCVWEATQATIHGVATGDVDAGQRTVYLNPGTRDRRPADPQPVAHRAPVAHRRHHETLGGRPMSKVKVVMNPAGVRALLNAPGVVADLDARAERIRAAAGPGFFVRRRDKRINRYASQVRTADDEGRRAQADGNVLMKALDAGR